MNLFLPFRVFCPIGIDTAAVILAVQVMLLGERDGAKISVLLFEIVGQPFYAVLPGEAPTDFVEPGGVLMGADGQRRTKPPEAALRGGAGGIFQAQLIARVTARAALALPFQPLCGGEKFGGIIIAVQKIRPTRLAQKTDLFPFALFILGEVGDVGIIIEHGDGEGILQRFQTARRARPAAAMQQEGCSARYCLHEREHFTVAVNFVHGPIIMQKQKMRKRRDGA